jgi:membrane-associated phospholipid phosphatase
MYNMNLREFADLLTFIFNPPIVAAPTFLTLILLRKPENSVILISIALIFASLIPLTIVYALARHGTIPDIWASVRETRVIPFSGAICSYVVGSLALVAMRSPAIITCLMLCYVGNSVVVMLISFKWKISVHASGIAGPLTALIYVVGLTALPLLLLVVPVGWARLKLKAHTPTQVVAGALLTIVTTWIQLGIYLRML